MGVERVSLSTLDTLIRTLCVLLVTIYIPLAQESDSDIF